MHSVKILAYNIIKMYRTKVMIVIMIQSGSNLCKGRCSVSVVEIDRIFKEYLKVEVLLREIPMLQKFIFCWFFILVPVLTLAFQVNKCCPENEVFRLDKSEIFCESATNDSFKNYYWLPEHNKTISEDFEMNSNTTPCPLSQAKLYWNFSWVDNGIMIMNDEDEIIYREKSFCIEYLVERKSIYAYVCPCVERVCINKCCYEGEHLQIDEKSAGCKDSGNDPDWNFNLMENANNITLEMSYNSDDCEKWNKTGHYLTLSYKLLDNGSIDSREGGIIDSNQYCVDYLKRGNNPREVKVFACLDEPKIPLKLLIYGIQVLFGAFFLLITAIIQFWMPEMGGSPKWALPIQVTCLFVAYVSLAYQQLSPAYFGFAFCKFIGFLMLFSFLASFFWLNVMCIDLSWTFSRIRAPIHQPHKEKIKFIWYSVYAWSGSFMVTLAAVVVELTPSVSIESPLKPNFGVMSCWFTEKPAEWLFFFGPIGILLLSNLILFMFTSFRIILLKRGSKILRRDDSRMQNNAKNIQSLLLYIKMFMLMGVSWLTEIISSVIGDENLWGYLWYVTDTINLMRAVFIFIIFCCKKKIWTKVKVTIPWTARCEQFILDKICKTTLIDNQEMTDRKTNTSSGGPSISTSNNSSNVVSPTQEGNGKI